MTRCRAEYEDHAQTECCVGRGPTICADESLSEWSQLEAAYGQPLPATLRVQIQDLTNKFLEFAVFELAAAPVSDAIDRAEMLSKPGATLLEILCVGHDNHAVMAADR